MRVALLGFAGLLWLSNQSFGVVLTTEAQVRQAIIGNTISGTEDGKPYTEYYQPDGYIHGEDPDGQYVGEWRISRGSICVRYFEEDSPSRDWECMGVEIVGSRFAWVEDGKRYAAQLVPGNPNHL